MMEQVIDTLHNEVCNLVVLHEGHISTFNGHGVRHLYDLAGTQPELFFNSKVAIKALGRTAATMLISSSVAEVYADVMSEEAANLLASAGVKCSFERKVNHHAFLQIWKKMGELNE